MKDKSVTKKLIYKMYYIYVCSHVNILIVSLLSCVPCVIVSFLSHVNSFLFDIQLNLLMSTRLSCYTNIVTQLQLLLCTIWESQIYIGTVVVIWQLDLQLPMQSVPITTKVVSTNPVHGEVCLIQHYVINLSVICGRSVIFSGYSRFPPPIKLTATI